MGEMVKYAMLVRDIIAAQKLLVERVDGKIAVCRLPMPSVEQDC
jgi:hypothetical protein